MLLLLHNAGKLVTNNELLNFVWADKVVGEDILPPVAISNLRKLLGDSARQTRYIKTIPGDGYKFIGELKKQQQNITQELINYNLGNCPDTLPLTKSRFAMFWAITIPAVIILLFLKFFLPVDDQIEFVKTRAEQLLDKA